MPVIQTQVLLIFLGSLLMKKITLHTTLLAIALGSSALTFAQEDAVTAEPAVVVDEQVLEQAAEVVSEECTMPAGPIIPDGNVASQDELIAAQKAIKGFQQNLIDYRVCVDEIQKTLDPESEGTAERIAAFNALYDSSVDAEARIAEEFNVAVKAFKARQ